MNETRDIQGIESQYQTILENEDSRVWKSGDCPEALADSPYAHKHAEGTGALGVHDREDIDAGFGDTLKPEKADEDNTYYMKKISERLKENEKKSEKSVNEDINNSKDMSTTEPDNIFDKLYSTIMEGDDPFADLDGGFGGEDEMDSGDEELDIGGDEVTLSLPRDLAEKLHDALMSQLGDDDGDDLGDDLGDGGDDLDDEMLGDAVVSQPEPKEHHGDDRAGNKNNKVKNSMGNSGAGNAQSGHIKEDPTPKDLSKGNFESGDHEMANKKDNKVSTPGMKAPGE